MMVKLKDVCINNYEAATLRPWAAPLRRRLSINEPRSPVREDCLLLWLHHLLLFSRPPRARNTSDTNPLDCASLHISSFVEYILVQIYLPSILMPNPNPPVSAKALYGYQPSLGVAVIGAIIFTSVAGYTFYQYVRNRTWFLYMLILGVLRKRLSGTSP
jgi:hypothetical protein